jgi:hypothetical protein
MMLEHLMLAPGFSFLSKYARGGSAAAGTQPGKLRAAADAHQYSLLSALHAFSLVIHDAHVYGAANRFASMYTGYSFMAVALEGVAMSELAGIVRCATQRMQSQQLSVVYLSHQGVRPDVFAEATRWFEAVMLANGTKPQVVHLGTAALVSKYLCAMTCMAGSCAGSCDCMALL